jgi:hypothetical protein
MIYQQDVVENSPVTRAPDACLEPAANCNISSPCGDEPDCIEFGDAFKIEEFDSRFVDNCSETAGGYHWQGGMDALPGHLDDVAKLPRVASPRHARRA